MDLSAAFDTVDHDLLLSVLQKNFGITGSALQWYDAFLRPRKFKVAIGNAYSSTHNLTFSVPQGSASGANLFTAYCASLIKNITSEVNLQGFADDHFIHKCFHANSRQEEARTMQTLTSTMLDVKTWMDKMRLKLNTDKTEFILIGNEVQLKKCITSSLQVGSDEVKVSEVVRCLGAFIDKNLSFKHHINMKVRSAMFSLRRIRSIRKYLTRDATQTLVQGLVISHLDYCNSILVGLPKISICKLQRIQNAAAKLVL